MSSSFGCRYMQLFQSSEKKMSAKTKSGAEQLMETEVCFAKVLHVLGRSDGWCSHKNARMLVHYSNLFWCTFIVMITGAVIIITADARAPLLSIFYLVSSSVHCVFGGRRSLHFHKLFRLMTMSFRCTHPSNVSHSNQLSASGASLCLSRLWVSGSETSNRK